MHVVDWFATILSATGANVPDDRVIDSVNQLDWLTGAEESKARVISTGWGRSCTAPSGATSSSS